ncbi:MAG TPA: hypothetical protein VF135_12090, partial [Terriglobales bacterium]
MESSGKNRPSLAAVLGVIVFILLISHLTLAAGAPRRFPLKLSATDVIPTGNEWIALPDIHASDGALTSFNVLSMRDRGLLEVVGERGTPALQPYFTVGGKRLELKGLSWELVEYWIPVAHFDIDGMEGTLTYCAQPGSRAAFIRLTVTNRRSADVEAGLGLKASWGALNRVTYLPVEQRGERTVSESPW